MILCMIVKTRVKVYPDGTKKYIVYENPFAVGYEKDPVVTEEKIKVSDEEKERIEYMNMVRRRTKIYDYIYSNHFEYFITFTFSSDKVDRYDYDAVSSKLDNWLRYMRKKYGKFRYVIVPEYHEDKAYHFHAVVGGFAGRMIDSGKVFRGQIVYNVQDWRYGWSTATEIRDRHKVASYVTKYITKAFDDKCVPKGKKNYWSSVGLKLPVIENMDTVPEFDKEPDWQNDHVKIYVY